MRKPSHTKVKHQGYEYLGTTSDGVRIIKPPTRGRRNLTDAQIRSIVEGLREAVRGNGEALDANQPHSLGVLTPRERDVVDLLVDGKSSADAGRQLGILPRTVERYQANAMEKLGARDRTDLIRVILGRPTAAAE